MVGLGLPLQLELAFAEGHVKEDRVLLRVLLDSRQELCDGVVVGDRLEVYARITDSNKTGNL
jgi:hypothetical protein